MYLGFIRILQHGWTFCSTTEHGLKIIFHYTCVPFQEYNNRYQKEVFVSQSKHTAPALWNKPHSSNTLYISLAQQIQVGKQEGMSETFDPQAAVLSTCGMELLCIAVRMGISFLEIGFSDPIILTALTSNRIWCDVVICYLPIFLFTG